jgi:hypothetical protein
VSSNLYYQQRPDGIHEFLFTGRGNGMDEFFAILTDILQAAPRRQPLYYLVDVTHGGKFAPIAELVKRFRRLQVQIPERAPGRTAIIHAPGVLLTLANMLIDTLAPGEDRTRFFTPDQREQALAWLAAQDEAAGDETGIPGG